MHEIKYRPLCRIYGRAVGETAKWLPVGVGIAAYAADAQPSVLKAAYISMAGFMGYTLTELGEMVTYNWLVTRPYFVSRKQGERMMHRWQVATYAMGIASATLAQAIPPQRFYIQEIDSFIESAVKTAGSHAARIPSFIVSANTIKPGP